MSLLMYKPITNFVKDFRTCENFSGNHINEFENVLRCSIVSEFSNIEVVVLGMTDETFGFDGEYLLFRLHKECRKN